MAVGDNGNERLTGCLTAPGGEGTFYADAISAAQAALISEGSSTAQNVIILLSDGEANISLGSSDMDFDLADDPLLAERGLLATGTSNSNATRRSRMAGPRRAPEPGSM